MKKINKVILGSLLLGTATLLLTGCELNKTDMKQDSNNQVEEKTNSKGNCSILDCINKIDVNDTVETVNKTMGFDGEVSLEGESWKKYKWALNDDESVEVTFYESSKTATITINFKNEKIQNSKVDFSEFPELKKQVNSSTGVNYDKFKESFKAEGTLVEKSSISNKYRWVNKDGGYMDVTFSASSGKCTFAMGRY